VEHAWTVYRLIAFERNREAILHAYTQIGILELKLRTSIPPALLGSEQTARNWYEKLTLNQKGVEDLERAKGQKPTSPEDLLSLSFWRYLLSNKNYGGLWLPHLHKAFPGVSSPKDIETFREIDRAMDSSLRLRHKIAHYNLDELENIEHSVKKVEWLVRIMK
jgi:hypothetical protein